VVRAVVSDDGRGFDRVATPRSPVGCVAQRPQSNGTWRTSTPSCTRCRGSTRSARPPQRGWSSRCRRHRSA